MGLRKKPLRISVISLAAIFTVWTFASFFGKGTVHSAIRGSQGRSSKLSGVLNLQEGCEKGYYQVTLVGMLENSNIRVESQTDSSGRFNLTAPAGKYEMSFSKGNCGSKEGLELSENSEDMVSVTVREIKSVERFGNEAGRIPASILIMPTPISKRP